MREVATLTGHTSWVTSVAFSPDGKRVLFVSENREAHKGGQAYEIDLTTGIERRVTFHDGEVSKAIYTPDGTRLVYASSTDEIKEDPYFIGNLKKRFEKNKKPAPVPQVDESGSPPPPARIPGTLEVGEPGPFEIYSSRVDGADIKRLTRSPGFDAYPTMAAKTRALVFCSERQQQRDLYSMSLDDTKSIRRLTSTASREIDPDLSNDGQSLAYVKMSDDLTSGQIMIADGKWLTAGPITTREVLNVGPAWHPNGQELVFASNRSESKAFDLYSLDKKGTCMKQLTASPSDEIFPAFSPDGRKIVFSSNHSGNYQIYIMDHQPPSICLTEAP
jgi:Tol biopolymer transport system component